MASVVGLVLDLYSQDGWAIKYVKFKSARGYLVSLLVWVCLPLESAGAVAKVGPRSIEMDDIEAAAMRIHHGASWSDLGAEARTDVLDALVSAELLTLEGMRHLQFTVNTIVFALTQEGGVTQQLMARMK